MYVDKWGRKPTMWITGLAMACDMSIIMGLTAGYAGSDNRVAQGFTIAFIFMFSILCVFFLLLPNRRLAEIEENQILIGI
jgi:cbb3-type cytochrome oxidase subunit 3